MCDKTKMSGVQLFISVQVMKFTGSANDWISARLRWWMAAKPDHVRMHPNETILPQARYCNVLVLWQVVTIFRLPAGKEPKALEHGEQLKFEEPAYKLRPGGQGDFSSDILRLVYTSLTTPSTTLDHNMATGRR